MAAPAAGDGAAATPPEEEETEEQTADNWACCDTCDKWRRLPDGPRYEANSLPDKWTCEMHPDKWTCSHPEESMDLDEEWDETKLLGEDVESVGDGGSEGPGGSEVQVTLPPPQPQPPTPTPPHPSAPSPHPLVPNPNPTTNSHPDQVETSWGSQVSDSVTAQGASTPRHHKP